MGFRDCRGIKTVLTFCLYSLDPGSWLVTFTISIDQNISETALFSISVISHKYLTIHLKHKTQATSLALAAKQFSVKNLKIVITVTCSAMLCVCNGVT